MTVVGGVEMKAEFIHITQGPAKLATDDELAKDKLGTTNLNLHRRIDPKQMNDELAPRKYSIAVQGVESYRTTESYLHDEQSTESETP